MALELTTREVPRQQSTDTLPIHISCSPQASLERGPDRWIWVVLTCP
jgi:hypothetical protein